MTAAQDGGLMALVVQIAPIVAIFILFYFLMIRPQQKRMKAHQTLIAGVKRGDEVVLSNGMVGKVTRVEDSEAMVEISQGVNVRVVKAMIAEVRNRTAIAANDKG
ncbi:preprotein translocase subunit YajC [Brevundimonas diminuta]|uniref:preprotein translocase subunit YajC n=1 Tax=Brevundimonas diminuta TaxID=293 RepID=UPI00320AC4A5